MTPAEAVLALARVLEQGELNEDAIHERMARAGLSGALAGRTYKFMQIACGRAFLAGLGVTFPPDYLCVDADGKVIESGVLEREPSFVAAQRLIGSTLSRPGLARFALMSADVGVVNQALQNGSQPQNLILAPPVLFLEPPNAPGLEAAQRITSERLERHRQPSDSKKPLRPWWRFWS